MRAAQSGTFENRAERGGCNLDLSISGSRNRISTAMFIQFFDSVFVHRFAASVDSKPPEDMMTVTALGSAPECFYPLPVDDEQTGWSVHKINLVSAVCGTCNDHRVDGYFHIGEDFTFDDGGNVDESRPIVFFRHV